MGPAGRTFGLSSKVIALKSWERRSSKVFLATFRFSRRAPVLQTRSGGKLLPGRFCIGHRLSRGRDMGPGIRAFVAAIGVVLSLLALRLEARAQSVEDFYRGKTI